MIDDFEVEIKVTVVQETIDINDERLRVDCHPDPSDNTEASCIGRKCLWRPSGTNGIPWCIIDKNRLGYSLSGQPVTLTPTQPQMKATEYTIQKQDTMSFYGKDLTTVKLLVEEKGAT